MSGSPNQFPLSPMQMGILGDCLSAHHTGVYIQQLVGTIHEYLDRDKFRHAWQQLSDRHASLRTFFDIDGKVPYQEIADPIPVDIDFMDWRNLDDIQNEEALQNFLQIDRQRGFDIGAAPLFRVAVFELANQRYRFVWTSHHLLFDGRSRLFLLKELYGFYGASESNASIEPPDTYRHFVDRCLAAPFNDAKKYWRAAWPLDTDDTSIVDVLRDEPSHRKSGHGTLRKLLDSSLTHEIRKRSRELEVGQSTLFHAAWALLETRYTGSEWAVVGVTRSCRRSNEDSLVGLCVNTVPLAMHVAADDTIQSLCQRTRHTWKKLDNVEHSAVNDIARYRGSQHGLFDIILNYESYELNDRLRQEAPEWGSREFQLHGTTNLPLVISIYAGEHYVVEVVYQQATLDDAVVASLVEQYIKALAQLLADGERSIADVKLTSQKEFDRLTRRTTREASAIEQSITQRFDAIVASHGDAVALCQGQRQLTYAELDREASRIAAALTKQQVRPTMRVGVLLDRGFAHVSSLLAILKLGAAYVPLDPRFPADRNHFIVHDAELTMVVTEQRHAEYVQKLDTRTLLVDKLNDSDQMPEELSYSPNAEDAAYIIYTSGSTGDPKGVITPHRGVVRLVVDNDFIPFGPDRVFLLHSSVNFDASTLELWGALLHGGRCVIPEGEGLEVHSLGEAIQSHGVDCLWLTSSFFNLVVDEFIGLLKNVKYVLVGGEALSVPHIVKALEELPDTQLINGYGPTENTTFTCTYPIPVDFDRERGRVPIGKPINHTYVYIVDRAGLPVPVGFPGELVIGGVGLANGYLNRQELTARQFISDRFSSDKPALVYLSGDRCRWLDDGNIEFLGRFDDQQKIRGFRVEPGETNAVLSRHPDVVTGATLIIAAPTGDRMLESWAVLRARDVISAGELKQFLTQRLPHYSVPNRVNIIDRLPLTASGKVDRAALLQSRQQPEPAKSLAPDNALVKKLMTIWSEKLALPVIDQDSNFFDLGGNSLSGMSMLRQIEEQLGVNVSLHALLVAPTPALFAKFLVDTSQHIDSPRMDSADTREEYVL